MKLSRRPFVRDTTPNSLREALARLATVLLLSTLLGAPVLAFLALAGRDEGWMRGALLCALTAALLLATRRLWRTRPVPPAGTPSDHETAPANSPVNTSPPPAPAARPRILLLDASLNGPGGNSSRLLDLLAAELAPHADLLRFALSGPRPLDFAALEPALRAADGFVFATGTHWDSWSSPLQGFLEAATPAEAGPLWLGKPAAVLVTEHSVGGKGVLSRLQGVLVTLGCSLPPLSGLVLSRATQLARRATGGTDATEDFWSTADLPILAHNLLLALAHRTQGWRTWPVDRSHFHRPWLESTPD